MRNKEILNKIKDSKIAKKSIKVTAAAALTLTALSGCNVLGFEINNPSIYKNSNTTSSSENWGINEKPIKTAAPTIKPATENPTGKTINQEFRTYDVVGRDGFANPGEYIMGDYYIKNPDGTITRGCDFREGSALIGVVEGQPVTLFIKNRLTVRKFMTTDNRKAEIEAAKAEMLGSHSSVDVIKIINGVPERIQGESIAVPTTSPTTPAPNEGTSNQEFRTYDVVGRDGFANPGEYIMGDYYIKNPDGTITRGCDFREGSALIGVVEGQPVTLFIKNRLTVRKFMTTDNRKAEIEAAKAEMLGSHSSVDVIKIINGVPERIQGESIAVPTTSPTTPAPNEGTSNQEFRTYDVVGRDGFANPGEYIMGDYYIKNPDGTITRGCDFREGSALIGVVEGQPVTLFIKNRLTVRKFMTTDNRKAEIEAAKAEMLGSHSSVDVIKIINGVPERIQGN